MFSYLSIEFWAIRLERLIYWNLICESSTYLIDDSLIKLLFLGFTFFSFWTDLFWTLQQHLDSWLWWGQNPHFRNTLLGLFIFLPLLTEMAKFNILFSYKKIIKISKIKIIHWNQNLLNNNIMQGSWLKLKKEKNEF